MHHTLSFKTFILQSQNLSVRDNKRETCRIDSRILCLCGIYVCTLQSLFTKEQESLIINYSFGLLVMCVLYARGFLHFRLSVVHNWQFQFIQIHNYSWVSKYWHYFVCLLFVMTDEWKHSPIGCRTSEYRRSGWWCGKGKKYIAGTFTHLRVVVEMRRFYFKNK